MGKFVILAVAVCATVYTVTLVRTFQPYSNLLAFETEAYRSAPAGTP